MTGHGFADRAGLEPAPTLKEPHAKVKVVCWMLDDRRVMSVLVVSLDRATDAWLPRKQISIVEGKRGQVEITLPKWLAIDRRLWSEPDATQWVLM